MSAGNVIVIDRRGRGAEVTQDEYASFGANVRAKVTAYSLIVQLTTNEARALFHLGGPL